MGLGAHHPGPGRSVLDKPVAWVWETRSWSSGETMGVFSNLLTLMSGTPALVGLFLAALVIFLASDWRVLLAALLIQYLFVGLLLTHSIGPEVVLVKILVGVLVVGILLLSARHIPKAKTEGEYESLGPHFLGLHVGWLEGPLGFPLRLLSVFLVILTLVRVFGNYPLAVVPLDVAMVAFWLGAMGILGLVLSGNPLRVAVAVLTILAGFDLVYSSLEPSLAVVGFLSAFYLGAALAFAFLTTVHSLTGSEAAEGEIES